MRVITTRWGFVALGFAVSLVTLFGRVATADQYFYHAGTKTFIYSSNDEFNYEDATLYWDRTLLTWSKERIRFKDYFHAQAGSKVYAGLTVCGVPDYTPAYWNEGGSVPSCTNEHIGGGKGYSVAQCNNCYNYATNVRLDELAAPGAGGYTDWSEWNDDCYGAENMNCSSIENCAEEDKIVSIADDWDCEENRTKVALFIDSGTDYHWYRRDDDGYWSHKWEYDYDSVTNEDYDGDLITDPKNQPDFNPPPGYVFCGYMCVCTSEEEGQGTDNIPVHLHVDFEV